MSEEKGTDICICGHLRHYHRRDEEWWSEKVKYTKCQEEKLRFGYVVPCRCGRFDQDVR